MAASYFNFFKLHHVKSWSLWTVSLQVLLAFLHRTCLPFQVFFWHLSQVTWKHMFFEIQTFQLSTQNTIAPLPLYDLLRCLRCLVSVSVCVPLRINCWLIVTWDWLIGWGSCNLVPRVLLFPPVAPGDGKRDPMDEVEDHEDSSCLL